MTRPPPFTTLLLGLSLVLSGCAWAIFPPALQAAPHPKKVTLQLSWHHQFQFAGYYLAEILGYYEQEGLQAEIREGQPGVVPVEEVLSGRAEFGIGNSGLLVQYTQGRPVLALAAISQHAPTVLVALKRSGIRQMDDLAGKRVMLQPEYGSLSLLAMLQQTGMMERIVRIDSSMDIQSLIDGETDLFNGYVSNEPFLLEKQGIEYTLFSPYDYGIQFYSDILFTRQELYSDYPQLVASFRRASLRGWQYAMDHPEKAINLITQFYRIDKDKSWLRYEANKLRELVVPDLVEIGHMSHLRWEKISEQLNLMGLIPYSTDLTGFLFNPQLTYIDWKRLTPYIASVLVVLLAAVTSLVLLIKLNRNLRREVHTRQQAEHQATHMATHDPLTGLPNRILFMDRLEGTLQRARREQHSPGLLFFDLDNFKVINDTYGHNKGDEALQRVAEAVSTVIRESDTFARLGGDEFTLLVENCDELHFQRFAEKVLNTIQQALLKLHTGIELGASIGLLVIEDPMKDADTVLSQADHLMYRAKFDGKNHIKAGKL